ncbi:MAG: N-6 DNA methylase [Candidatus Eremiobacteraeota bacterium]|nr:N-6 DNA methylase [Candidatus Eremiobacteraeota bacterium]
MLVYKEKLNSIMRREQEARNYPASCRWYSGLRKAINHIDNSNRTQNEVEVFRCAWSAIYNLSLSAHVKGDDENKTYFKFVGHLEDSPSVRKIAKNMPMELLKRLLEAEKTVLYNNELQKYRDSKQCAEIWLKKPDLTPEKACNYVFTIARDLRNVISHPTYNPSSIHIRHVFELASPYFIMLAEAAIETIISHPIQGTTGKTELYIAYLWPFMNNSDSFFSDYYIENLLEEAHLGSFPETTSKEKMKKISRSFKENEDSLKDADYSNTGRIWCEPFLFEALGIKPISGIKIATEKTIFTPAYIVHWNEGGSKTQSFYDGKNTGKHIACLIWLLPWSSTLDAVYRGEDYKESSYIDVVHQALIESDVPWAIITNGRQLRLLNKTTGHKPRCFFEIDLEAIKDFKGDNDALLAFRIMLCIFSGSSFDEKDMNGKTRLDKILEESQRHGKEIGDELKSNVYKALERLGDGFLNHLRRLDKQELDKWRKQYLPDIEMRHLLSSDELLNAVYQESLVLMYRLLFLFYAESRDMLPMDDEVYRVSYSLESIRDEIISVIDSPQFTQYFGEGNYLLWERLKELFSLINNGFSSSITAFNGGLFDPAQHAFIEQFAMSDRYLSLAIDHLSRTRVGAGQVRGQGRKKFTYRDLDVRHLGSIYEGILEYTACLTKEDQVSIKRSSKKNSYEEFKNISELDEKEKHDYQLWLEAYSDNHIYPQPPKNCKVTDFKKKDQYILVFGGKESKRKSSGSYYTPDYIVQYMVENTLGPLIKGENRENNLRDVPLSSDEILELKVLDPAMGSGHFLVAAVEYLAKAYGEALIKEGKDADGVITDEEYTQYKRRVAERCVYGVDINPMAVELAKLSLWLITMDSTRPLSFLNHHLKCGNSLIGAWIKDLGELPVIDKKSKRNLKQMPKNQISFFEKSFKERLPSMVADLISISRRETVTSADINVKKALEISVEATKIHFKNIADIWTATYFGEKCFDYEGIIMDLKTAKDRHSKVARVNRFFHWEIEFPEVWYDEQGGRLKNGGFDAVVGNPPYLYSAGQKNEDYFREYKLGEYQTDYYVYFIERALSIIKHTGMISIITPDSWLGNKYFFDLRDHITVNRLIREITIFTEPPFKDASIENAILITDHNQIKDHFLIKTMNAIGEIIKQINIPYEVVDSNIKKTIPTVYSIDAERIIRQIEKKSDIVIKELFFTNRGVHAYRTDGYGKSKFGDGPQTTRDKKERSYHSKNKLDDTYRPFFKGQDIDMLSHIESYEYISYGEWLAESRTKDFFDGPRIVLRKIIGKRIIATFFTDDTVFDQSLYIAKPKMKVKESELFFYLGQLISNVMAFYLKNKHQIFDQLYPWYTHEQLYSIPIVSYDLAYSQRDAIAALVKSQLNQKNKKHLAEKLCEIDELVADIFNLDSQQRKIINSID